MLSRRARLDADERGELLDDSLRLLPDVSLSPAPLEVQAGQGASIENDDSVSGQASGSSFPSRP
eukprot:m.96044 g.96044  ORF g.96044 m.96044 type:complete len:64 (+) comp12348_c0_seq1:971-1162(+)